jgi:hypothetical protein
MRLLYLWASALLARTGLVDEAYYKLKYPDVAESQLSVHYHYIRYGIWERRFPNPFFEYFLAIALPRFAKIGATLLISFLVIDRKFYLSKYPDVARSGISAYKHYCLTGRREGRHPNRLIARVSSASSFLQEELNYFSTPNEISDALIEEHRKMIFEAARSGKFLRLRGWAIHRKIRQRARGERLFLRHFPTVDLLEAGTHRHAMTKIESSRSFEFREPEVIGSLRPRPLRTINLPEKWLAEIENASIIGGFQVLTGNHFVIYEPAANPHSGFVAGIWPYISASGTGDRVLAWFRYSATENLSTAILLSGRCSPNYYHWLIEYLGRAYILSKCGGLRKIPLIVDDQMFEQEFESLEALLPDWPIHRLSKSSILKVKKLYIPSIHTNLADNLREPMWKSSAICFQTLAHLRNAVFSKFGLETSPRTGTRKIFLARRSGRNVVNAVEIEEVLISFGYEIVDSGELSFEQQVRLFHGAAALVGAMGAAFSNLIFCQPGTQVLALSSPYSQLFCSQSNMALFSGCLYRILAGQHPLYQRGDEETVSDPCLFLDSFTIDAAELRDALWEIEQTLRGETHARSTHSIAFN